MGIRSEAIRDNLSKISLATCEKSRAIIQAPNGNRPRGNFNQTNQMELDNMAANFIKVNMVVSKRENKEFKKVGEVDIFVPPVSEITAVTATAEIKKGEDGKDMEDEGLPVFTDDRMNWLYGAVYAAVKAQARNKLQPGTATLKDNNKIATNWDELVAEGVRDGAGLKIARECKAAFAEWVSKQGLSEAAGNTLITLFGNKAALQLQSHGTKEKVKARILAFGESLSEEDAEKFNRPVSSVLEACEAAEEDALEGI